MLNFPIQAHHGAKIAIGIKAEADAMFGVFVALQAGGAARTRHHVIELIGHLQRQPGFRRLAFAVRFHFRHVGHRARGAAVAHPASFIHPARGNRLWQPGPQAVHGQKVGFVRRVLLQATLFRFATVAVKHALTESGLPGEGKNVAVKISVSRRGERFSAGLSGGEHKGKRGEILPEHVYS